MFSRRFSWLTLLAAFSASCVDAEPTNDALLDARMGTTREDPESLDATDVPTQVHERGGPHATTDLAEDAGETTAAPTEAGPTTWTLVHRQADWEARDSAGELVFQNQLWIMGGWLEPFFDDPTYRRRPTPRDVWRSADGQHWTLATGRASWTHGDAAMVATFHDKMWLMGGWENQSATASNEVWSSVDGEHWELVAHQAAWSPRVGAGIVAFQDKLWILGGVENYLDGNDRTLKNDIWCSSDGRAWTLVADHAPWRPRSFHSVVAFDHRMWVLGGGNYKGASFLQLNDVWWSEDGVQWHQTTSAAPWAPRIWHTSAVYRNRLWVLGGWANGPGNYGDAWYSRDGVTWTELAPQERWSPRHEHSTYVFADKLWVAGGNPYPVSNEVWSLHLPAAW